MSSTLKFKKTWNDWLFVQSFVRTFHNFCQHNFVPFIDYRRKNKVFICLYSGTYNLKGTWFSKGTFKKIKSNTQNREVILWIRFHVGSVVVLTIFCRSKVRALIPGSLRSSVENLWSPPYGIVLHYTCISNAIIASNALHLDRFNTIWTAEHIRLVLNYTE